MVRERHLRLSLRCGNAAWTKTCFAGAGTPTKRHQPSGVRAPDRHWTRSQVSLHREKGTLCVASRWIQDWERLDLTSLRGRGAQCFSPPSPDLEAEGKEGRPRTLKRARPTTFLPSKRWMRPSGYPASHPADKSTGRLVAPTRRAGLQPRGNTATGSPEAIGPLAPVLPSRTDRVPPRAQNPRHRPGCHQGER